MELFRAGQHGVGGHVLLVPILLIEGFVEVQPSIRWFITPVMLVPHLEPPLTFSSHNLNYENVGRSKIVGTPVALLALHNNATVTICHSRTKNLKEITKTADILISACGQSEIITHEYIKEYCVITKYYVRMLT